MGKDLRVRWVDTESVCSVTYRPAAESGACKFELDVLVLALLAFAAWSTN